jgi:hypothetical protein
MPLTHVRNNDLEKDVPHQIDDVAMSEKDIKSSGAIGGDYSGAVAKSDPLEIALVRKLDTRIMPTLFCMYFL